MSSVKPVQPNLTIQLPKYTIDYLITVGPLPANSEAIGKISILFKNVFLS